MGLKKLLTTEMPSISKSTPYWRALKVCSLLFLLPEAAMIFALLFNQVTLTEFWQISLFLLVEIVEAYYGKIYGDFRMLQMRHPSVPVASVMFTYYLNPKNLDCNLEWNRDNLCSALLYPRPQDRRAYKCLPDELAP